ncbi:MAG: CRISPR-associated endonuclease Cas3'' [Candidatus Stygibacter frigidus]|nr:CRISPR-associated endonuclease Cas3'' [Candidatus Stygibacter frigidus]
MGVKIERKLLSHPEEEGYIEKRLEEHLENVSNLMVEEVSRHSLELSYAKPILIRLVEIIGITHDFGKATTWFQEYLRGERKGSNYTHHSLISAIVTYNIVLQELEDELLAYIAFQVVLRHHGNLSSFDISNDYINYRLLTEQFDNIKQYGLEGLSDLYSRHGLDTGYIRGIIVKEFSEIAEDL